MTIFTDKAKTYVPRLMTDLQITRIQACGIFGNIGAETGGFIYLQELKPTVKGSRGGFGWLQWTGPRRRKFEEWCKANNLNPASDDANYRYLVKETLTDEAHSLAQLKKTNTLEAAAQTFMAQNLRPGVPNLKARIDWAHKAYDASAEQAQVNKTTGVIVGPAAGGAVVLTQTPHHYWPWIILGIAVSIVVGLILVNRYHAHEADKAKIAEIKPLKVARPKAKKGKKQNG